VHHKKSNQRLKATFEKLQKQVEEHNRIEANNEQMLQ
jgi:hypothetical protein